MMVTALVFLVVAFVILVSINKANFRDISRLKTDLDKATVELENQYSQVRGWIDRHSNLQRKHVVAVAALSNIWTQNEHDPMFKRWAKKTAEDALKRLNQYDQRRVSANITGRFSAPRTATGSL